MKKKINSAFSKGAFCPSCKKYVVGQGGAPDPAWKCIYCPVKICAYCYDSHTAVEHPETYDVPIEATFYVNNEEVARGTLTNVSYSSCDVKAGERTFVMEGDGESYTVVDPNRVTPV